MSSEGEIVPKVWGNEHILTNRQKYCAKILEVHGGMSCSLHRHHIKEETFIVLSGNGWIETPSDLVTRSEPLRLERGCFVHLKPGQWHRFWTEEGLAILEVSTAHSDEDVEREIESGEVDFAELSPPLADAVDLLEELLNPVDKV